MPDKIKSDSELSKTRGGKLVKTNDYLNTDEDRKHWYKSANLGKQQGKPKQNVK
jgi:hypothetical protein